MATKSHFLLQRRKLIKRVILLLIAFIVLQGCGRRATYRAENIESGLTNMLKTEFGIDSTVRLEGNSLGVSFSIPKLIPSPNRMNAATNDLIQSINLCLRRVLLSSDVPLEFYQVTIRGEDTGVEIAMVRNVKDLKLFGLSGISLSDYQKRMLWKQFINLSLLGKQRIEHFFRDLGNKEPRWVRDNHFGINMRNSDLGMAFINNWMWHSAKKVNQEFHIQEVRMKSVSPNTAWFYCRVKEYFEAKHGFQNEAWEHASGEDVGYVILVQAPDYYRAKITKVFYLDEKEPEQKEYMELLRKELGDPEHWPENDFFMDAMTLERFIAEQIAGRVRQSINEQKKDDEEPSLSLLPRVLNVEGEFKEEDFNIYFFYSDPKVDVVEPLDLTMTLDTAKQVIKAYRFKDFKEVNIGIHRGKMNHFKIRS